MVAIDVRRRSLVRVLLGLLLAFGLSPLGGSATAQTQPSHSRPQDFVIYFPKGSTHLGSNATKTVARAAAAVSRAKTEGNFSHVKVIGYSTKSGGNDEAQRLAEERASVVRKALVQAGVPDGEIRIEGRAKPKTLTGGEVNQPRNRRVRIVIYRPGD